MSEAGFYDRNNANSEVRWPSDLNNADSGTGWPAPTSPSPEASTLLDSIENAKSLPIDTPTPQPMFHTKTRKKQANELKKRAEHMIKAHLRQANSRNKDVVDFYNFDP